MGQILGNVVLEARMGCGVDSMSWVGNHPDPAAVNEAAGQNYREAGQDLK